MRIAIIALGSRGDVQPYVALGKGLQQAGHDVRIVTHENFAQLVQAQGLTFCPVRGNVQEITGSKEMRELLDKGQFVAIMKFVQREATRAAIHWAEDGQAACQGMDLLIAGVGAVFSALQLAEKLDIPLMQAYVIPFTPTRAFRGVILPQPMSNLGGAFNRMSHQLTQQVMWQTVRSGDNAARKQVHGLPNAPFFGPFKSERFNQLPILYGISPSVLAKPADWDDNIHMTGYWFLEADDWTPPAELTKFLQDGPPPIYIGFGSMNNRNPEATADLMLQALERAQQRAVMLSGWDGLRKDALPDTVYMAETIPHSWLFQHVAAVIHHGGAGTTAAGLRAGVPSIITPFFGDQPFWGERVVALGVGPTPIPRKKLTVDLLAQAIQTAMNNQAMRQRAAELGASIRAEDSISAAAAVIQRVANDLRLAH
jgi:sterol 3beta-glucosyltransferase